jgi:hypothetical protein
MLRLSLQPVARLRAPLTRAYAVKDEHNHEKPTSQGHVTEKNDGKRNIQSEVCAYLWLRG